MKIADAEYEDYNKYIRNSNSSKSSSFWMDNQKDSDNMPDVEIEGIFRILIF